MIHSSMKTTIDRQTDRQTRKFYMQDAQRSKHGAFVGNTGLLMDNRQLQQIKKKENVIIKLCTTHIQITYVNATFVSFM